MLIGANPCRDKEWLISFETKQCVAQVSRCPSTTSFPKIIFRTQTFGDRRPPADWLKKALAWKTELPVLKRALAGVAEGSHKGRSLLAAE